MVAQLSAALIAGLQSSGVAATAKHFPGHGDTSSDSHHSMPVIPHSLERLRKVELPPFNAAIQAGVKLVMTGHLALPAVESRPDCPATMSPAILGGLLRRELGFTGVVVTDAMDMGAIRQAENLGEEAVRAAAAGADLLLLTSDPRDQVNVTASLLQAAQNGSLSNAELEASVRRVRDLKNWLAAQNPPPDLSVVGCASHQAVAAEIAARSITLVQDYAGLLPIRLQPGQRLGVIVPRPQDLTPADTSSYVTPALAGAMRTYHPYVDEFIVPYAPQDADIASVLERFQDYGLVIIGTINAFNELTQANLVRAVLGRGIPAVIVAMRMPYDLQAFPEAPTYLCCYSILPPSMHALARALWGQAGYPGRLPVSID
jgi:beta-N-acetylhexosaminidase